MFGDVLTCWDRTMLGEGSVNLNVCGVTMGRKLKSSEKNTVRVLVHSLCYLIWISQASWSNSLACPSRMCSLYEACTFPSPLLPALCLTMNWQVLMYFLLTICFVANPASFLSIQNISTKKNFFCDATAQIGPKAIFWGFWITQTHTQPVGPLWTSDQLVADTAAFTTRTQEMNFLTPGGIRILDSSNQAAAELCLRPHCNQSVRNSLIS
jgi:hypothetical protein